MSLLASQGDAIAILAGYLIAIVAGGGLAGWVAYRKGRSVVGWVVLGVLFSLWAVVVVALLPAKPGAEQPVTLSLGAEARPPSPTEEESEAEPARLREPAMPSGKEV